MIRRALMASLSLVIIFSATALAYSGISDNVAVSAPSYATKAELQSVKAKLEARIAAIPACRDGSNSSNTTRHLSPASCAASSQQRIWASYVTSGQS